MYRTFAVVPSRKENAKNSGNKNNTVIYRFEGVRVMHPTVQRYIRIIDNGS